ncbi:MAG: hypothetical protein BWK76_18180 [Desulfobulbaceae bacterium A2]|nr:MAG: hypothetical protein BWK76_18180 [Desulfobulbaceae bacterium A2]
MSISRYSFAASQQGQDNIDTGVLGKPEHGFPIQIVLASNVLTNLKGRMFCQLGKNRYHGFVVFQ